MTEHKHEQVTDLILKLNGAKEAYQKFLNNINEIHDDLETFEEHFVDNGRVYEDGTSDGMYHELLQDALDACNDLIGDQPSTSKMEELFSKVLEGIF